MALRLLIRFAVAAMLAAVCLCAHAQSYPGKPIRSIVPLAPGGGNDTLARFTAKQMSDGLGQQIVVENRPGGGGLVGGEFAARIRTDIEVMEKVIRDAGVHLN